MDLSGLPTSLLDLLGRVLVLVELGRGPGWKGGHEDGGRHDGWLELVKVRRHVVEIHRLARTLGKKIKAR